MMTRLRRLFRRPAAPSPASRAAFERATTDPFAEVAAARLRMRDLITSPPTGDRLGAIAGTFDDFATAMQVAVTTSDERMIGFVGRFLADVDKRQSDRIGALSLEIQRLALDVRALRQSLADIQQSPVYKTELDGLEGEK